MHLVHHIGASLGHITEMITITKKLTLKSLDS